MQIHFTVERNHVVEQDYTDTFVTNKTFQEVVADAFPNFVCWEKTDCEMFLDVCMGDDYCSVRAELVSQEHPAKKSSTDVAAQMLMKSLKPKEDNRLCMVENEYTYDDCDEEWEA